LWYISKGAMGTYINIHSHRPAASATTTIENLYRDFERMEEGRNYSIGLHPWHLQNHKLQLDELLAHADMAMVKAIGECGLDKVTTTPMDVQEQVFTEHIKLAAKLRKPMIVHCVQAHNEVVALLKKYRPAVPVVFHGYNKRHTVAEMLIDEGYYLSFGAAILNRESPAAQVLSVVPAHRIFLETDDAEIHIEDIYKAAASLRNSDTDSLILQVANNFNTVFNI
jgi:TatD DNase family protein